MGRFGMSRQNCYFRARVVIRRALTTVFARLSLIFLVIRVATLVVSVGILGDKDFCPRQRWLLKQRCL